MLYNIFLFVSHLIPPKAVYAHCDIPCGIYTPEPARTAAKTVLKMTEKLAEAEDTHDIIRFTAAKEEYAQRCKTELLVLWTDYFKPEQLKTFPELHETFWKAAKLCSRVKQEGTREDAQALVNAVEEIVIMFQQAEKAARS